MEIFRIFLLPFRKIVRKFATELTFYKKEWKKANNKVYVDVWKRGKLL